MPSLSDKSFVKPYNLLVSADSPEVSAMIYHEEISHVPGGYAAPKWITQDPKGRSWILSQLVDRRECVSAFSAMWVYFGIYHRNYLEVIPLHKKYRGKSREVKRYRRTLWDTEYTNIQGLRITTPARTALDILFDSPNSPELGYVAALSRKCGGYQDIIDISYRHSRFTGVNKVRYWIELLSNQAE